MVFAIDLTNSIAAFFEAMLPRPCIGLSRPNWGASAFVLNTHPPISTGAAIATNIISSARGVNAINNE